MASEKFNRMRAGANPEANVEEAKMIVNNEEGRLSEW
jgi:hypothetical protein